MANIQNDVSRLEAVPGEIAQLPLFQHLEQVMPAADLFFGAGMLMFIILVHAAGVRSVTNHVVLWSVRILARPTRWRADLLMSGTVFLLLSLHLLEIFLWTAALVYSGLVSDWRAAGFFAGNTYTTVGYGSMILPAGWRMLAPIIAISGLFTFGWSGSVLVDLVARCQKIKDAAGAG
ncbi:MAG: ion channel [Burkholderiales bacterium]